MKCYFITYQERPRGSGKRDVYNEIIKESPWDWLMANSANDSYITILFFKEIDISQDELAVFKGVCE